MKNARAIFCAGLLVAANTSAAERVHLIQINGVIGPATAQYVERAVKIANNENAAALVIQLDTPGGLLDSTKVIVQSILGSLVPVVVYVAPSGANATSAGTFITLAAHVAAMAPGTTIGAAHPVAVGQQGEQKPDDTMKQKLEQFASSYIATIAQKRSRNVEWARAAVEQSASITDARALELNVVDVVAENLEELLKKIDGKTVDGVTLRTADADIKEVPMIAREKFFHVLFRPEVAYILLSIATLGIIFELSNPGAILPGVVGGIALILSLYALAVLPVNVAGLLLIGFAILLFIADAMTPTHGILTVGGVISFLAGSFMLFERSEPLFQLSLAYIVPITLLTAGFFAFVVSAGIRAQFRPVKVGRESMIGEKAMAAGRIDERGGKVFYDGSYWNAVSRDGAIETGESVEIVNMDGLTLEVRRKRTENA
jgi:membrane-bound serine protease (ClpP class)